MSHHNNLKHFKSNLNLKIKKPPIGGNNLHYFIRLKSPPNFLDKLIIGLNIQKSKIALMLIFLYNHGIK